MKDKLSDNIRSSAENQAKFEMPDNALSEFKKYRSERDIPTQFPWLKSILGICVLALVLSNAYWLWSDSKQMSNLQKEVVYLKDTVFITKYIDKETAFTDMDQSNSENFLQPNETIISKKEYANLKKAISSLSLLTRENQLLQSDLNSVTHKLSVYDLQNKEDKVLNLFTSESNVLESHQRIQSNKDQITNSTTNSTTNSISDLSKITLLGKLPLHTLCYTRDNLDYNNYRRIVINTNQRSSFFDIIRPKSLSLFSSGGVSARKIKSDDQLTGAYLDVGFSTLFSRRIRAKLGFSYSHPEGQLKDDNDEFELPPVVPPANGDLHEIYLSQRSLSMDLDIEYLFKPISLFRPFAGVNYRIGKEQFADIKYEYDTPTGEVYVRAKDLPWKVNQYIGVIGGVDIDLFKSFDAHVNMGYLFNINGEQTSYVYLSSGLYYHF